MVVIRLIAILIVLTLSVKQGYCALDDYRDKTWMQESSSGNCVFVFIPSISVQQEAKEEGFDYEQCIEIQSKYKVTGLYSSGDTPQLLWAMKSQYMSRPIFVSDDMKSLVIPGEFALIPYPLPTDDVAIFINQGEISSRVRYSDIAWFPQVRKFFTSAGLIKTESSAFNADSNEYIIKTNLGEMIVLDAATGNVNRYQDPIRTLAVLIIFSTAAIIALWLFVSFRMNSSQ